MTAANMALADFRNDESLPTDAARKEIFTSVGNENRSLNCEYQLDEIASWDGLI